MQDYKQEFIKFALAREVLKFGEFTLKSGRKSPYFFNAGLFNLGNDLSMLGKFYSRAIMEHKLEFDLIFGPAYKGIPLATAVAISLANEFNLNKPYCFNRKEAKDHGEGGNLVGAAMQGKILLVDDVITAGTAIREAVAIINANSAVLSSVVIALDRQERGLTEKSAIQEVEQNYNCKVISIINLADLISYISTDSKYQAYLPSLEEYRAEYGIA